MRRSTEPSPLVSVPWSILGKYFQPGLIFASTPNSRLNSLSLTVPYKPLQPNIIIQFFKTPEKAHGFSHK